MDVFSVSMWRNHIPKFNFTFPSQVLVSSDKRPCRNLTYYNVSARQGSSYCNRVRLNFQAFALRDMKIATCEGGGVGQKMSYHFSWQMFLLLIQSFLNLGDTLLQTTREMKNSRCLILNEVAYISIIYRIPDSWLYSLNGYNFSFDHMTGENQE